ncbi:MAG: CCA tRNA nucleotidyltransferase [Planctomycetota bacterium]
MRTPCDSPRQAALAVIRTLRSAGHTAYLAGGCVRDALLGLDPKDYDVATDATPDTVQQLFPYTAAVGAAFGVVLVYIRKHGRGRHTIEVATFRADGNYADGRRPDDVRFTTAEEDAQRRDFTINGLFADPRNEDEGEDTIIDYVGGQADLKAGVIRAIGEPSARFAEDYLRMLRAVRFAARFGFTIEPVTARAIQEHAPKLDQIARERIGEEVQRMLMGANPALAVQQLTGLGLDAAIFHGQAEHLDTQPLERLDSQACYATRLSVWMSGRKPTLPAKALRRSLMLSNDELRTLRDVEELTRAMPEWDGRSKARRKRTASAPCWSQAMLKWEAEQEAASLIETIKADLAELSNDGIGLAPTPLVTGEDLIAQGLTPGPRFKTLLDRTYDAQLEGRVKTKVQALDFARNADA